MIRRLAWEHPEWWTLAISLLAWVLLVSQGAAIDRGMHLAHTHVHATSGGHLAATGWMSDLLESTLMIAAMMLPLVIASVRLAAFRSLWRRRHLAIAGFLVGYVAMWSLASALMLTLLHKAVGSVFPWRLSTASAAALGLAIAAAWQLTSLKRSALRACHQASPLAPSGWRANADCLRYGFVSAGRCVANCWALMLVPMLASHNLVVMAGITVACGVERYRRRPQRGERPMAIALAGLALVCAMIASLGAPRGAGPRASERYAPLPSSSIDGLAAAASPRSSNLRPPWI